MKAGRPARRPNRRRLNKTGWLGPSRPYFPHHHDHTEAEILYGCKRPYSVVDLAIDVKVAHLYDNFILLTPETMENPAALHFWEMYRRGVEREPQT